MGITLILRRTGDPASADYQPIEMDEWLSYVDADPSLTIRTEDHVALHPVTGAEMMRMRAQPSEADFQLDGQPIPLLHYRAGTLVAGYRDSMDDETDLLRLKIAEIARAFNAEITHDAGDDTLAW